MNPSLRPNGSHKFAADSAMTKDAEVKPAEFETCSDRMVVEDEAGQLTELDQEKFGVAEMREISELEVGTSTSAEDECQSDWSLEECKELHGKLMFPPA